MNTPSRIALIFLGLMAAGIALIVIEQAYLLSKETNLGPVPQVRHGSGQP